MPEDTQLSVTDDYMMRRRQFLASASLGALSVGGGCVVATRLNATEDASHPLADSPTRVSVDNQSSTDHDVERNAWEALTFWEANSPEYVDFDFRFELVETNPDMVIEYADSPAGCQSVSGYSELVMGCAPLIHVESTPPSPVPVTVVAGNRPYGEIRITTQHEIGHTLGLGHDDDPRHVMSNRPEDRIPLYNTRVEIWDAVVDAQNESSIGIDRFSDGTDAWESNEYGTAGEYFGEASGRFSEARRMVESGQTRTDVFERDNSMRTVDLEGLTERLDRIARRLELAMSFASLMNRATEAALDDNRRLANSHLRDANSDIRSFNEVDPPQIQEVAVALGLVRGLDRAGTVVDLEDEAFGYGQR